MLEEESQEKKWGSLETDVKLGHINCVCVAREKYVMESSRGGIFIIIGRILKLMTSSFFVVQSENSNPFMFSEGRFGDAVPEFIYKVDRIRRSWLELV